MKHVENISFFVLAMALMLGAPANGHSQNTVKQDLKELRQLSQPDMAYRWALRTGLEADSLHALLVGGSVCADSLEHFLLVCYADDVVRERRLLDKKRRAELSRVVKAYWRERTRKALNVTAEEREEATAIRRDWSRDETVEKHRREDFFRLRAKYLGARPQIGRIVYFNPADYNTISLGKED